MTRVRIEASCIEASARQVGAYRSQHGSYEEITASRLNAGTLMEVTRPFIGRSTDQTGCSSFYLSITLADDLSSRRIRAGSVLLFGRKPVIGPFGPIYITLDSGGRATCVNCGWHADAGAYDGHGFYCQDSACQQSRREAEARRLLQELRPIQDAGRCVMKDPVSYEDNFCPSATQDGH